MINSNDLFLHTKLYLLKFVIANLTWSSTSKFTKWMYSLCNTFFFGKYIIYKMIKT